jgi:hypothetical protein
MVGVGSVGGPERSWAAWSGGLVPVAVPVLRHRDGGCRWALGGLLFLVRCRGGALTGILVTMTPALGPAPDDPAGSRPGPGLGGRG